MNPANSNFSTWKNIKAQYTVAAFGIAVAASLLVALVPFPNSTNRQAGADDGLPNAWRSSTAPYVNESADEYAAREAAQIGLTNR